VTHRDEQRLLDTVAAIAAIRGHMSRGALTDGPVFDAVTIRLLEIGEAMQALPEELLSTGRASAGDSTGPRSPSL
jgi:uncharacterized protein with HEPN domain